MPSGPESSLTFGARTRAAMLADARQRMRAGLAYRRGPARQRQTLLYQLGERVKELSLLHACAKLMHNRQELCPEILQDFVELLPRGWQFPEHCQARLVWGGFVHLSGDWQAIKWKQTCLIQAGGRQGRLEIGYASLPASARKQQIFLAEERILLNSLAELLQVCFERYLASTALEAREAHIRLLLDSTVEAIYGVDLLGCCTFANRASANLLGLASPDELIGLDMHALMHHSYADGSPYPATECPIHACLGSGANVHVTDDVFWRADGSAWPAEYYASPIRRGTTIVGAVVTVRNLTEMHRQQLQLQAQNQRLREIAWIQSHEIRRPLANLLGLLELLSHDPGNQDLLGHLTCEAQALDALVQGIVSLSSQVLDGEADCRLE